MKVVAIKSAIFNDPLAFQQILLKDEKRHGSEKGNPEASIPDVIPLEQHKISHMPELQSNSVSVLSPEALSPVMSELLVPNSLLIETCIIDLGRVEINEMKDCYITVTNRCDLEREFEVVLLATGCASMRVNSSGLLAPLETKRVDLSLTPLAKGQNFICCNVLDTASQVTTTINFAFYGILKSYVDFRPSNELDLGYCYVDSSKKYAAVKNMDVINVTNDDIFVSAVSNLSQQCFLFMYQSSNSAMRVSNHQLTKFFCNPKRS
jgi:hypothetical protein